MTPVAPEAAHAAATKAIQRMWACKPEMVDLADGTKEWFCVWPSHRVQPWKDECPEAARVAVKAADAAVAPIAAWVLREAAEDMSARLDTFPQQGRNTRAGWAENWLRARAVTWPLGGDRP